MPFLMTLGAKKIFLTGRRAGEGCHHVIHERNIKVLEINNLLLTKIHSHPR